MAMGFQSVKNKYLKVNILIIKKFLDFKEILTEFILVDIRKAWDLVKVLLDGIINKFFWGNGRMGWRMDSVNGKLPKGIIMKVNGCKIDKMDMAYLDIIWALTKAYLKIS